MMEEIGNRVMEMIKMVMIISAAGLMKDSVHLMTMMGINKMMIKMIKRMTKRMTLMMQEMTGVHLMLLMIRVHPETKPLKNLKIIQFKLQTYLSQLTINSKIQMKME